MGDDDRKWYKVGRERPWPGITRSPSDEKDGMKKTLCNMKVMMWKHMQQDNHVWNKCCMTMMMRNMCIMIICETHVAWKKCMKHI